MPADRLHAEAWIGDAVLSLYVRRRILERDGRVDGEKSTRMTSNRFLAAWGDPTAVEARIGRIYEADGLEAAFAWIEAELAPRFDREERNRHRR
ncbi:MAG: hypothetical protein GC160_06970 [Acidobacteria bacterium]|nr:hypothetical protein [Acidobacteriota bacterium]